MQLIFVTIADRIHFWYTSKNDVINIMTNSNLVNKRSVLYFFYFFGYV